MNLFSKGSASVAQWLERHIGNVEVASSTLARGFLEKSLQKTGLRPRLPYFDREDRGTLGGVSNPSVGHSFIFGFRCFGMRLESNAFANHGKIPPKYACDGENVSPPLEILDVPANAKSLVLLVEDPDIPDFVKAKRGIEIWDHWVLFNIPPQTTTIPENSIPTGALQGKTTGGKTQYEGPCPPDKEHRYFFRLYALDILLPLVGGVTKENVQDAMRGHLIEEAELVGRYVRT